MRKQVLMIVSLLVLFVLVSVGGYWITKNGFPQFNASKITVYSDVRGRDLKIVDENEFERYLSEWDVWNKNINGVNSRPKRIAIYLVSEPQIYSQTYREPYIKGDKAFLSVGYVLDKSGLLNINVQVDGKDTEMPKFGTTFDVLTLSMLYQLSHPDMAKDESAYDKLFAERKGKPLIFNIQ